MKAIQIIQSGNFKIAVCHCNHSNLKIEDFDLIFLNQSLKLASKNIIIRDVPLEISWGLNVNDADYLNRFKTKYQARLIKLREQKNKFKIITCDDIKQDQKIWNDFCLLYQQEIGLKKFGVLRINQQTYLQMPLNIYPGIFVYLNNHLAGGIILKKIKSNPDKITTAWRATRKDIKITYGINGLLMDELYTYAQKNKYHKITRGVDLNLYGGHLNIGLIENKLFWGYIPCTLNKRRYPIYSRYPMYNLLVVNKTSRQPFCFFAFKNNVPVAYLFHNHLAYNYIKRKLRYVNG